MAQWFGQHKIAIIYQNVQKKVSVFRAKIHKYYEKCDWSKKWADVL